jgi:hypothetical protein
MIQDKSVAISLSVLVRCVDTASRYIGLALAITSTLAIGEGTLNSPA